MFRGHPRGHKKTKNPPGKAWMSMGKEVLYYSTNGLRRAVRKYLFEKFKKKKKLLEL